MLDVVADSADASESGRRTDRVCRPRAESAECRLVLEPAVELGRAEQQCRIAASTCAVRADSHHSVGNLFVRLVRLVGWQINAFLAELTNAKMDAFLYSIFMAINKP